MDGFQTAVADKFPHESASLQSIYLYLVLLRTMYHAVVRIR